MPTTIVHYRNEAAPETGPGADGDTIQALMGRAALRMANMLCTVPQWRQLPPPVLPAHPTGLQWTNSVSEAAAFRRAHIEQFRVDASFAVLHVCVLPHRGSRAPIYGFDMLGGCNQVTGMFLDFSPVTTAPPEPSLGEVVTASVRESFGTHRDRPAWGGIFSTDFFAIRPGSQREVIAALDLACTALEVYLSRIAGAAPDEQAAAGQAAYAAAQRGNPHTLRMLARYVGPAEAARFMRDVLFPD